MTNNTSTPPDLLPCPWCDGRVELASRTTPKGHWVHCDGCACDGPIGDDDADAITAWNTRAPNTEANHLRCQLADVVNAGMDAGKP